MRLISFFPPYDFFFRPFKILWCCKFFPYLLLCFYVHCSPEGVNGVPPLPLSLASQTRLYTLGHHGAVPPFFARVNDLFYTSSTSSSFPLVNSFNLIRQELAIVLYYFHYFSFRSGKFDSCFYSISSFFTIFMLFLQGIYKRLINVRDTDFSLIAAHHHTMPWRRRGADVFLFL